MKAFKTRIALIGALTILAVGSAYAVIAPGPTGPGEFAYYLDENGGIVGYRAIDCQGKKTGWGRTSGSVETGVMLCEPIW